MKDWVFIVAFLLIIFVAVYNIGNGNVCWRSENWIHRYTPDPHTSGKFVCQFCLKEVSK